ncbi:MAG: hypothetical protein ABSF69_25210 [Polyangiaceae bacterium]|jgi:hypothetical protein
MSAPVDSISPDWLSEGITIGTVTGCLAGKVREAIQWRLTASTQGPDADLELELHAWLNGTFNDLRARFVYQSHALRFISAFVAIPLSPRRAALVAQHASLSSALVDVCDYVARERAQIARALEELEGRMAQHAEVVRLIRETNVYSEAVWQKIVIDPMFVSPVSSLLNSGVTQNALWDAIKMAFSILGGAQ